MTNVIIANDSQRSLLEMIRRNDSELTLRNDFLSAKNGFIHFLNVKFSLIYCLKI